MTKAALDGQLLVNWPVEMSRVTFDRFFDSFLLNSGTAIPSTISTVNKENQRWIRYNLFNGHVKLRIICPTKTGLPIVIVMFLLKEKCSVSWQISICCPTKCQNIKCFTPPEHNLTSSPVTSFPLKNSPLTPSRNWTFKNFLSIKALFIVHILLHFYANSVSLCNSTNEERSVQIPTHPMQVFLQAKDKCTDLGKQIRKFSSCREKKTALKRIDITYQVGENISKIVSRNVIVLRYSCDVSATKTSSPEPSDHVSMSVSPNVPQVVRSAISIYQQIYEHPSQYFGSIFFDLCNCQNRNSRKVIRNKTENSQPSNIDSYSPKIVYKVCWS